LATIEKKEGKDRTRTIFANIMQKVFISIPYPTSDFFWLETDFCSYIIYK